jgi:hypothetical protein
MDTRCDRLRAIANIFHKIHQNKWITDPSIHTYVCYNEPPKDDDHDTIIVKFPYNYLIETLSIGTEMGETQQYLVRGNEIVRICSGWWYADSLLERLIDEDFEVQDV